MKIRMKKNTLLLLVIILILCSGLCFGEEQQIGKIDYMYLLKTSWVMQAILCLSVATLAFVVERTIYFKSIKFLPNQIMKDVEKFIKAKDFDAILDYCDKKKNPLKNIVKAVIENKDRDKQDLEEIYEIVRTKEKQSMEKFMVFLGSAAAVAPLLGLLGTVVGIIQAFAALAVAGSGGPSVIASGVSEALVATAFGLVIAIPVLIIFNLYNNKIRVILSELDINVRLLFFLLEKK